MGRGGPSTLSVIHDLAVVLLSNESMARHWNGISEHLPDKSGPGEDHPDTLSTVRGMAAVFQK